MKFLSLLVIIVEVTILWSCEKIIDPKDLPKQDPLIVVNSIISTDQPVSAQISQSKSILSGKDYKYIDNAVCELYEDGVYIQNLTFSTTGNYHGTYIPKANKKYTLKVSATGFESVSATTAMPADFEVRPIERNDSNYRFFRQGYGQGYMTAYVGGENRFRVRIVDDPKAINYYSILPHIILLDSLDQPIVMESVAGIMVYNSDGINNGSYSRSSVELDDKTLVDGNEIVVNVSVFINEEEKASQPPIKKVQVFLKIRTLSKDYYQYKETLLSQGIIGPSLFAEPVQVYNNVEKGIGILAAINTTVMPASVSVLR